jgi:molybdate transport system regulatory protein
MGMSYKRAWTLIDGMNRCFAKPLVEGARGGGARLTPLGSEVLTLYRRMEERAGKVVSRELDGLQVLVIADTPAGHDAS